MNTWDMVVDALMGRPAPALPAVPGRVHAARDEPIDPKYLVGVTSSAELALLLGISRQTAWARLQAAGRRERGAEAVGRQDSEPPPRGGMVSRAEALDRKPAGKSFR